MTSYTIDIKPLIENISDDDLERLCASNPQLKFETNAAGNLVIMSPTGSFTGEKNADLIYQVQAWNRQYNLGKVFDSSTGFRLSNNSVRSPDVSWIALPRWNSLTDRQKRGFAPIDPNFVLELMSPTDDLLTVRKKMEEYMTCDIKLGWLINPDDREVEVYRQGQNREILQNPASLSGENVLSNLVVDLSDIIYYDHFNLTRVKLSA